MTPLALSLEAISPRRADDFGGKARSLGSLARAGFPVPPGFALSVTAFDAFVRSALPLSAWPATLLGGEARDRRPERLAMIREQLLSAPLPAPVLLALRDAYASLSSAGTSRVAVRSSGTEEDGEELSAAGLHETVLNVQGEEALVSAVKRCWASLYSERALLYLARPGARVRATPGIGIVVQAMVAAEKSGVLFTRNPLTGDRDEMLVNCALGLGSSVVDGRISPDSYRVDRWTASLRELVAGEKAFRVVAAHGGAEGVCEEPVPEELRRVPALNDAEVRDLVALGRRVEAHFGAPRDIEWSIGAGRIWVLQARPITGLAGSRRDATRTAPSGGRWFRKPQPRPDVSSLVWSNINVGEALPGVATPLTWSVLSAFSELGFRRAFAALGCSVPRDARLVGNFRGRIYLNMTEFMGIASQLPGLSPSAILSLGGGGELSALESSVHKRSSASLVARLPLTVARFFGSNWNLPARVLGFEEDFVAERARFEHVDLRILAPSALDQSLRGAERLLDRTGSVMLNVYGNLLASVVALRSLLVAVVGAEADRYQRDLLSGLADVESAAPGFALWHIAEVARTDEPARVAILGHAAGDLRIATLPDGPVRRALDAFLEAYGTRGAREAEMAEPRWREDAKLLFATLRGHLLRPPGSVASPVAIEQRRRAVRERAEHELGAMLLPPERTLLRHLLGRVRRYTRLRERLRGRVTDVLGMYRAVALEASRRLAAAVAGVGDAAAFFLTIDELHAYLQGRASDLGPLVRQRRAQHARDRALPDPPDTFVGAPPSIRPAVSETDALHGLAASPGMADGTVRVLTDPSCADQLRPGEILVAPYADIGWSPLFLLAAAVVTDMGGPLSHAAVIAREYGVPAVFNVKNGTRLLRTGQRVVVDGDAGVVRRVD